MNNKKMQFEIQLNSIGESNNPTQIPIQFILHDFDLSWNNAFISKETAKKALPTLKGMPIVCKYYRSTNAEDEDKNDALGGHEAHLDMDREGNLFVATDTIAIGVFTEDAFIETIKDEYGQDKEVVKGNGILWSSRYPSIIGLLREWWDKNIPVKSSMEILYDEYLYKEGKEEILNYVYEGHCILNSEKRGDHDVVLPAYDVSEISKFQRLVAEALKQEVNINNKKLNKEVIDDMANEKFKKIFELSFDDIRSLIYGQLKSALSENEYDNSWITQVYETYFILSYWNDSDHKFFKVSYTKDNDTINIDWENRAEVFLYQEWREIPQVQESLNSLETSLNEKEETIKQLNATVGTLTSEKEDLSAKFNEATNTLVALNSQVEVMKPIVETYNKEQYEKSLNEVTELYKEKFEAVSGLEKFKSEEVQKLVKNALISGQEGEQAKMQLNSMIFDMIKIDKKPSVPEIKETTKSLNNLIPTNTSPLSGYVEE